MSSTINAALSPYIFFLSHSLFRNESTSTEGVRNWLCPCPRTPFVWKEKTVPHLDFSFLYFSIEFFGEREFGINYVFAFECRSVRAQNCTQRPLNAVLSEFPHVFAFQFSCSRDDIFAFECSSFRIPPPPFFGFRMRQRLQRKLAIDEIPANVLGYFFFQFFLFPPLTRFNCRKRKDYVFANNSFFSMMTTFFLSLPLSLLFFISTSKMIEI